MPGAIVLRLPRAFLLYIRRPLLKIWVIPNREYLTLPLTMALQAMRILHGLSKKRMESHPKSTGGIYQCLTHLTSRKFP